MNTPQDFQDVSFVAHDPPLWSMVWKTNCVPLTFVIPAGILPEEREAFVQEIASVYAKYIHLPADPFGRENDDGRG